MTLNMDVVLDQHMTLNKHIERTIAAFSIVGTLAFGAWSGSAIASATPRDDSSVATVNLTDVHDIDSLADCAEEDGSGSASLPCVWINDGNTWLTYTDHSVLVIDDTVTGNDIGWDAGYEN